MTIKPCRVVRVRVLGRSTRREARAMSAAADYGETVLFGLSAPHLEEALNQVLRTIASDLARDTGIEPFWTA